MRELALLRPPSREALLLVAAAHPRDACVRVRPPAEGSAPFVLITCPVLARHVCESGRFERDLGHYERYRPFLGGSLLLQRGAPHTRARAALRPLFGAAHVHASLPELRACCARFCDELIEAQERSPFGCVPERGLYRLCQLFTLDVSDTLLGLSGSRAESHAASGAGAESARASDLGARRRRALRTLALLDEAQALAAEAEARTEEVARCEAEAQSDNSGAQSGEGARTAARALEKGRCAAAAAEAEAEAQGTAGAAQSAASARLTAARARLAETRRRLTRHSEQLRSVVAARVDAQLRAAAAAEAGALAGGLARAEARAAGVEAASAKLGGRVVLSVVGALLLAAQREEEAEAAQQARKEEEEGQQRTEAEPGARQPGRAREADDDEERGGGDGAAQGVREAAVSESIGLLFASLNAASEVHALLGALCLPAGGTLAWNGARCPPPPPGSPAAAEMPGCAHAAAIAAARAEVVRAALCAVRRADDGASSPGGVGLRDHADSADARPDQSDQPGGADGPVSCGPDFPAFGQLCLSGLPLPPPSAPAPAKPTTEPAAGAGAAPTAAAAGAPPLPCVYALVAEVLRLHPGIRHVKMRARHGSRARLPLLAAVAGGVGAGQGGQRGVRRREAGGASAAAAAATAAAAGAAAGGEPAGGGAHECREAAGKTAGGEADEQGEEGEEAKEGRWAESEPGEDVVVSPWLLQRLPSCWGAAAAMFDPARHHRPSQRERARRAAWLPFSAGPKRCPASVLALAELQLLAVHVLLRFRACERVALVAEAEGSEVRAAEAQLGSRGHSGQAVPLRGYRFTPR